MLEAQLFARVVASEIPLEFELDLTKSYDVEFAPKMTKLTLYNLKFSVFTISMADLKSDLISLA